MSYEENKKVLSEWLGLPTDAVVPKARFEQLPDEGDGLSRGRVVFATAAHLYTLNFHNGYLGAGATCRTARPGENWLRGGDLPDGPFAVETVRSIIEAIFTLETVVLDPVCENQATPSLPR